MSRLADMMRVMAGDDDADTPTASYNPDPLAQAMELRERFARLSQVHKFQPGDIVRGKPGVCSHKPELNVVNVFVRYLDTADAYDKQMMSEYLRELGLERAAFTPDCVIADIYSTEGGCLTGELIASAMLEPTDL